MAMEGKNVKMNGSYRDAVFLLCKEPFLCPPSGSALPGEVGRPGRMEGLKRIGVSENINPLVLVSFVFYAKG